MSKDRFADLSAGAHDATIAIMRPGGKPWFTVLRLLLAAVVGLVVSVAPAASRACPMAAKASSCPCPCCDLEGSDRVQRPPCCVKEGSVDPSLPVADRADPPSRSIATPAAVFTLSAGLWPTIVRPAAASMVLSTGPPIWLARCSLLR